MKVFQAHHKCLNQTSTKKLIIASPTNQDVYLDTMGIEKIREATEADPYVKKGWTVVLAYDPETNQYQSLIPELQVGTSAPTRREALDGMEEALLAMIEMRLELGMPIEDPPVVDIESFLPNQP